MATLRKLPESKYWIAQFRMNGKTVTRSTRETDKRKARQVAKEIERQARLLNVRPCDVRSLSEARVAEVERAELDIGSLHAQRVEYMLWNFEKWMGDVPLDRITSAKLEEYAHERLRTKAKETVKKELTYVVKMMKRNGFSIEKPTIRRGRVTEQRAFTKAELLAFFEHCPIEFRALFSLMLCTGARPAELIPSSRSGHIALLKSEVDQENGIITIRSAKVHPGQKQNIRRIEIQPELMEEVVAFGSSHSLKTVFLPMTNLFRHFNRIIEAASIEKVDVLGCKVTAHSFRHTFATLMAEAVGHSPFVLKQILGHSQITTTDRYCHPVAKVNIIDMSELLGRGVSTGVSKVSEGTGSDA